MLHRRVDEPQPAGGEHTGPVRALRQVAGWSGSPAVSQRRRWTRVDARPMQSRMDGAKETGSDVGTGQFWVGTSSRARMKPSVTVQAVE